MKFLGVVAVLCVVPSDLVLYIGISSCTFPPWTEMSKKNDCEYSACNLGPFLESSEFFSGSNSKAIRKTPTCLFCKAGLFISCKGNRNKKNC